MNLITGFDLDDPEVRIPWRIRSSELKRLLGSRLREITRGYHTISCSSLGGLHHELGFHFHPRLFGRLTELEFFRTSYSDQRASFDDFQGYFVRSFGPPTKTTPGTAGFPSHEWLLPGAKIRHYVFDRFGPEEHMRVEYHAP